MEHKLSPLQQSIFNAFHKFEEDVAIPSLYTLATAKSFALNGAAPDMRTMQQYLGPHITRINDKLKASKIVPGQLKQTYRMVRVPKES